MRIMARLSCTGMLELFDCGSLVMRSAASLRLSTRQEETSEQGADFYESRGSQYLVIQKRVAQGHREKCGKRDPVPTYY